MDLQNIEEFHCAVCFEIFGENQRCPRMLTCGHSFCHSCLEKLLDQRPSCPNCKQEIQFPNVEYIPVNYIVKSLVSRYKVNNSLNLKDDSTGSLPLKEKKLVIFQKVDAEINIQNYLNQNLDIYLKYLVNEMSSLKKEIKQLQLELSRKIESLKSLGKNMEKLHLLKSEREKYCERVILLSTSVIITANDEQFINATSKFNDFLDQSRKLLGNLTLPKHYYGHLTVKVLKDWCQEKSVYAFRCQNGSNQYGKVEVKGGRVWIHCFVSQKPPLEDVILSFRELLITFNGSTELPKRGFIQVDDGTSALSDVVIATDALTPRAMNFLLLCSGIKGKSYEGKRLISFGWKIGTPFEVGGGAVVDGISDGGVYEAPWKKGSVYGWEAEFTNHISEFDISMEDEPKRKLRTKFGFVEEGIEVCEIIFSNKKNVAIKHFGLVI